MSALIKTLELGLYRGGW